MLQETHGREGRSASGSEAETVVSGTSGNIQGFHSSYSFSKEGNWLELQAASGSVLWGSDYHAPRLLQEVSGDFAVEVLIEVPPGDLPSVGGLLVWNDRDSFIRFERGTRLENEIAFIGHIQGKDDYFGRGRLASDMLHLRLERMGDVFSPYCSDDGDNWMTCGYMDLPAEDLIKVGVYAMGVAWFRGWQTDTATQFGSFRVMKRA